MLGSEDPDLRMVVCTGCQEQDPGAQPTCDNRRDALEQLVG
jgi:hypothetical protein